MSFLPTTRVNIAAEGVSITKSASFRSFNNVPLIVSPNTSLLSKMTWLLSRPSSSFSDAFESLVLDDKILEASLDFAVLLLDDFVFFLLDAAWLDLF